jgi:hypothetical protein
MYAMSKFTQNLTMPSIGSSAANTKHAENICAADTHRWPGAKHIETINTANKHSEHHPYNERNIGRGILTFILKVECVHALEGLALPQEATWARQGNLAGVTRTRQCQSFLRTLLLQKLKFIA